MIEKSNSGRYDLEDRTFGFARQVRSTVKQISVGIVTRSDILQLIRSSGSIGANYIEANESLSKKDFLHRIKICRKEAKETIYWINLLAENCPEVVSELQSLRLEATELMKIFGAIIQKLKE